MYLLPTSTCWYLHRKQGDSSKSWAEKQEAIVRVTDLRKGCMKQEKKIDKTNLSAGGQARQVGHRGCGIPILADAQNTAGIYPQTPHLTWKPVLPWAPWGWARDLQKVPFRLNYSKIGSDLCFWANLSSMGMLWSSYPWMHTLCLSLLLELRIPPGHPLPFGFPEARNKSAQPGGKTQLWGAQGAWCGIQGPTAAPAPSHQRDAHTHARASPLDTRWGHMCLRNPQFKHILKSGNFGKPQLILVPWQHQEISWSFESNACTANTEAALSQSLQWGKKNQNLMIILWIATAKLTKVAIQRSGYA